MQTHLKKIDNTNDVLVLLAAFKGAETAAPGMTMLPLLHSTPRLVTPTLLISDTLVDAENDVEGFDEIIDNEGNSARKTITRLSKTLRLH